LDFITSKSSARDGTGILLKSVPLFSTAGIHSPLLEVKEAEKIDSSNDVELNILSLRLSWCWDGCLRGF